MSPKQSHFLILIYTGVKHGWCLLHLLTKYIQKVLFIISLEYQKTNFIIIKTRKPIHLRLILPYINIDLGLLKYLIDKVKIFKCIIII